MNPVKQFKFEATDAAARVTRRHWFMLTATALAGCGGGGSDAGGGTAGVPGTGGTGMYAQGSISGFGSIIVNGIKFDDTAATVQIDGLTLASTDLRLGMVASVQAKRGTDLTLGTASQIEVWSIAQGPVSNVQSSAFSVAGMHINTNSATILDGISTAQALLDGVHVAVWGLQAGADGSSWTATRVAVVTTTSIVSTGLVAVTNAQRSLHGLPLTGGAAANLSAGQLVRVEGSLSQGHLDVSKVNLLGLQSGSQPTGELEIEGLVTATSSNSSFMLGNVAVQASGALFTSAVPIAVGQRIEVHGNWQGQVLMAVKVELEDGPKLDEAEIDARIDLFTSLSNFTVRGQRCDASGAEISHGSASELKVGVKVKVKGTKAGEVLLVTKLELDH